MAEKSPGSSLLGPLKEGLASLTSLMGISYVLGFVVVNSFLVSRGIVPFTVLNIQYLAAGACFLFFYVVTGIIFHVVQKERTLSPSRLWQDMVNRREAALSRERAKLESQSRAYRCGYAVGFRPGFSLGFFVSYLLGSLIVKQWRSYLCFCGVVVGILWLSVSDLGVLSSPWLYGWVVLVVVGFGLFADFVEDRAGARWVVGSWALVALLASALVYGRYVHPSISPAIGGGKPSNVRLLVKPEAREPLAAPLGLGAEEPATPSVQLLFESGDHYIVSVTDGARRRTMRLEKTLFRGVIYESEH